MPKSQYINFTAIFYEDRYWKFLINVSAWIVIVKEIFRQFFTINFQALWIQIRSNPELPSVGGSRSGIVISDAVFNQNLKKIAFINNF